MQKSFSCCMIVSPIPLMVANSSQDENPLVGKVVSLIDDPFPKYLVQFRNAVHGVFSTRVKVDNRLRYTQSTTCFEHPLSFCRLLISFIQVFPVSRGKVSVFWVRFYGGHKGLLSVRRSHTSFAMGCVLNSCRQLSNQSFYSRSCCCFCSGCNYGCLLS